MRVATSSILPDRVCRVFVLYSLNIFFLSTLFLLRHGKLKCFIFLYLHIFFSSLFWSIFDSIVASLFFCRVEMRWKFFESFFSVCRFSLFDQESILIKPLIIIMNDNGVFRNEKNCFNKENSSICWNIFQRL